MFQKLVNLYKREVPKDTRYNFIRDCIGNVYSGVFSGIYSAFFAIVARKYMHCSALQIGLITCAGFIAGVFAMFAASFCPVNKENKGVWLLGCLGSLSLILFIPFVQRSWSFTIACMCFSLLGCFGPLYNVVIERIYRYEIRAKLLSYPKTLGAAVTLIITGIAGWLMSKSLFGYDMWRILFVIAALCYMGNMYFCFYKIKMPKSDEVRESPLKFLKDSFALLKTDKPNTWLIVSGVFFTVAYMITNTLAPIYQNDVLKIGPKEVSYYMIIQYVFWLAGFPLIGNIIAKKGPLFGWILTCLLGVMMALGYILCPHYWQFLLLFYVFFGLFNVGHEVAWLNLILYIAGGKKVTEYQALHQVFLAVRGALGLVAATKIIEYADKINLNYKWIFGVSVLMLIISMVIVFIAFGVNKKYKK